MSESSTNVTPPTVTAGGAADPALRSTPDNIPSIEAGARASAEAGLSRPRSTPKYKLSQSIQAHKRAVTALRWSASGRMLVTAGADGYVHIFTTSTTTSTSSTTNASTSTTSLTHFQTIRAHRSGISDLSLSPDDLYLATASDDCTARIFALPSPLIPTPVPTVSTANQLVTPLRTLAAHTAPILTLSFSPRSNLLVTAGYDESAILWDVRTGNVLKKLPAHSEAVWTTGWDREGGVVLTGSADGYVRLWDSTSGQCLRTLDNDTSFPVTCALFTPNPFYLMTATASPEMTVRVYNIHTGRVVKTLRPEGTGSESDGELVYGPPGGGRAGIGAGAGAGGGAGDVGGRRMPVVCAFTQEPLRSRAQPSRKVDRKLSESEFNTNEGATSQVGTEAQSTDPPAPPPPAEERSPSTWVMATTHTGPILIWDLATRKIVQILQGHMAAVTAMAVHPDGTWIATGSVEPEKVIKVWKLEAGHE